MAQNLILTYFNRDCWNENRVDWQIWRAHILGLIQSIWSPSEFGWCPKLVTFLKQIKRTTTSANHPPPRKKRIMYFWCISYHKLWVPNLLQSNATLLKNTVCNSVFQLDLSSGSVTPFTRDVAHCKCSNFNVYHFAVKKFITVQRYFPFPQTVGWFYFIPFPFCTQLLS